MEAEYLSVKQVCTLLGVSEPSVRKRVADGRLPAYKYGDRVLIKREDVDALLVPFGTDEDGAA